MADLVPPHAIAEVTELLQAPYLNSFGSTETGLPPATRALIAPGEVPERLSKQQSAFCQIKLVDPSDQEVAPGEPGELAIRGATLFSGYWQADETNAHDFRGGWFHMGDVFRRNADGSLDFVDRAKYLIKSGGENVYPAEIERVLLSDTRITEAAVVRAADPEMGRSPGRLRLLPRRQRDRSAVCSNCAGAISRRTSGRGNSTSSISRNFRAPPAARSSATNSRPGSPRPLTEAVPARSIPCEVRPFSNNCSIPTIVRLNCCDLLPEDGVDRRCRGRAREHAGSSRAAADGAMHGL